MRCRFQAECYPSRDGRWPLLARPYHFKGWIGGEVTFSDAPGVSDASGKLHWERSQFRTAALFPQRFAADVTIIATRFSPTDPATWFDYQHAIGNGRWVVQGGDIVSLFERLLTIDTAGVTPISSASSDRFTLSLDQSSGFVRGSFVHPSLNRSVAFRGIVLQKRSEGYGCFVADSKTGMVALQQNPAIPGTRGRGINGDAVPPAITIYAPAAMARIPEVSRSGPFILPSTTVSGVASDDAGIGAVEYQILHKGLVGSLYSAAGTGSWSIPLYLNPVGAGDYVVFVKAIDANGNESDLASRKFTYVVTRDLEVTVAGGGTVTEQFIGITSREVGRDYTIQAIAAPDSKFVGWTGSVTTAGSSITLTMSEGMQLQASFAPK